MNEHTNGADGAPASPGFYPPPSQSAEGTSTPAPRADRFPLDPAEEPESAASKPFYQRIPRPVVIGGVVVAALFLLAMAGSRLAGSLSSDEQAYVFYEVQKGELPIVVTERGNLESQDSIKIQCEVDDIEGDGIRGTPILSIVPNGSSVKKGDLLVEFDTSNHVERLDRQVLDTERAKSEQIQARVKFENQKTQNETNRAEAKLAVDLAELALKQFEDETGGTFQLDLQDVELQIQEAQASKLIEETNLTGVEQLYKLGYRSGGELAQARLSAMKADRQLATTVAKKKELVQYEYLKRKLELEGAVKSAERKLLQVERDNEAELEQAKAAMDGADRSLAKEEERLQRYQSQVNNSKIIAELDGMVAYATGSSPWRRYDIREGAAVYPSQTILTLPNLKKMQVKTSIHESVLDQVKAGMRAIVRVDALPDQSYIGSVHSIAVLPDQNNWMGADTKVYETVVTIDEEVDQIKPGMTAVVEIQVARLKGVISIPVQAAVQVGQETWCYVGESAERRKVTIGRSNDKFVEIKSGLEPGERVVLNPSSVPDTASTGATEIAPAKGYTELPPEEELPPTTAENDGAQSEDEKQREAWRERQRERSRESGVGSERSRGRDRGRSRGRGR